MLPSVFPRLATDSAGRVFPGVWKPLFLKFPSRDRLPFPGRSSLPTSFVSFFIFYIFSYLFLKTMVCFSGCLMSSASLQKLFCGVCSVLKCSFEEFVREKVVFPSYSSAILGPPPPSLLFLTQLPPTLAFLSVALLFLPHPSQSCSVKAMRVLQALGLNEKVLCISMTGK